MFPEQATPASRQRFDLARQIAEACPPALADAIAVSGSVARGWSDDDSDLELNFWGQDLPPESERAAWMMRLGVTDLEIEPTARDDDSWWIGGCFQGVPIEFGWQTCAALDRLCDALLSGTAAVGEIAFLGDLLAHVLPLRGEEEIAARQARVRAMSERVQRMLIVTAAARFKPGYLKAARRLAARGETLALNEALMGDLDAALRLMYAAHRRWLPGRKWRQTAARAFAPADWLKRFDDALCVVDPTARVDAVWRLVREALLEVPCYIDVSDALSALEG